jgi:phosphodiesterase/alkaline phosphatase D-like protein
MQFSPELRPGVASGDITLSFRLWSRLQVKVGGQYATTGVRIEIDSIEMVPFSSVTPADVRQSGEESRESLRQRTAHAGPVDDDTLVYRIEFHLVP